MDSFDTTLINLDELEKKQIKEIVECYKKHLWNESPTGTKDNPVFSEDLLNRISCLSGYRIDVVEEILRFAIKKDIIKIN